MGLAERRAAKNFEDTLFPKLKAEVVEAAKFDVPIEVKWDQLTIEGQAHLYDECWPQIYFRPLVDALKAITVDDMGKDALKAKLKKIVIENTDSVHYGEGMPKFDGSVLTLDHKPTTNVGDVKDRTKAIQQTLEKAL